MKHLFLLLFFILSPVFGLVYKPNTSESACEFKDTLIDKAAYTELKLLEKIFNNPLRYYPLDHQIKIQDHHKKTWTFTLDNPYVRIDTAIYNLVYPIRRNHKTVLLPTLTSVELLRLTQGRPYSFIDDTLLEISSTKKLLGLDYQPKKNGAVLRITLSDTITYHTLYTYPYFIINLEDTQVDPGFPLSRNHTAPVKQSLITLEKDFTQLTIVLSEPIDTIEMNYVNKKNLDLLFRLPTPIPKPVVPETTVVKKKSKVIIIDPGHGGKDPGAISGGAREKDVTLNVGKELKRVLIARGYEVHLTREDDTFIALGDRPKIATNKGGDLFLSLHCNAIEGSPKKLEEVSGFVAYILREGESEEDKALARRENQAIKLSTQQNPKTNLTPVDWILLEHELNLYTHQSERFAENIVKYFENGHIEKHRTGAHQAGFFVLVGTFMPAVLFEMGFITNPKDREYMTSQKGVEEISERLAKAIDDFFR